MQLIIDPNGAGITWEQFLKFPKNSVALDGWVRGAPQQNRERTHINFDHHMGVQRDVTECTCAQVHQALVEGHHFISDPKLRYNVYVGDCDQDVSLSVALLKNQHEINLTTPNLAYLILIENMLDKTAGVDPLIDPNDPMMRQITWLFQPYTDERWVQERTAKGIACMCKQEMYNVIDKINSRFLEFMLGNAGEVEPDLRYQDLEIGGKNWAMIKEVGAHSRGKAFRDLEKKCLVSLTEYPDGTYGYIAIRRRLSGLSLVPFCEKMNEIEGTTGLQDRWGGGDLVVGPPRLAKSKITPKDFQRIVEKYKLFPNGDLRY